MTRPPVLRAAAAAVLLVPALGWACGACVEDKMAATYDHAVVLQAAAQRKLVVYCEVQGRVAPEHLKQVVSKVQGVDPSTIRISQEPAALSFVVDPAVGAPAAVAGIAAGLDPAVKVALLKSVSPR